MGEVKQRGTPVFVLTYVQCVHGTEFTGRSMHNGVEEEGWRE